MARAPPQEAESYSSPPLEIIRRQVTEARAAYPRMSPRQIVVEIELQLPDDPTGATVLFVARLLTHRITPEEHRTRVEAVASELPFGPGDRVRVISDDVAMPLGGAMVEVDRFELGPARRGLLTCAQDYTPENLEAVVVWLRGPDGTPVLRASLPVALLVPEAEVYPFPVRPGNRPLRDRPHDVVDVHTDQEMGRFPDLAAAREWMAGRQDSTSYYALPAREGDA